MSPYIRKNYISHTPSSMVSVQKSIYSLLGVGPLNLEDGLAAGWGDIFTSTPDLTPYTYASYINPLTAWALAISTHNLKEGDWLLQTAAASSVGKFVLQLAQQYRFKTINVIRRREQESIIRNFGGDEVICTADEDLRSRLQE